MEAEIQEIEISKARIQKKEIIISRAMLLAIFGCFLLMIIFIYSPVTARNNFDKKIIQIAPYVDDIELAHLNADWVSMENRDDYLILKEKIQNIMETNGIK